VHHLEAPTVPAMLVAITNADAATADGTPTFSNTAVEKNTTALTPANCCNAKSKEPVAAARRCLGSRRIDHLDQKKDIDVRKMLKKIYKL